MTQQIETIQQLDIEINALDMQVATLNMEFLNALQSPVGATNGKTALEVAATVIDRVRSVLADKSGVERRRDLIQQLATAAFAPVEFTERETALRGIADRARQLALEAQNAEQQAKAARSRAESTRTRTIDELRAAGLTNADLNKINDEIQRAKATR